MPEQAFGFYVEEMKSENLLYRLRALGRHLNDTATMICKHNHTVQASVDLLKQEYPGSQGAATPLCGRRFAPLSGRRAAGGRRHYPGGAGIPGWGPKRCTQSAVLKPVSMAPTFHLV